MDRIATAISLVAAMVSPAFSATHHILPENPAALAEAISSAAAGDTIVLATGVFHGPVTVEKSLTLRGEEGAVVDGTVPLKAVWTKVDGPGNVFITDAAEKPDGLLSGGKFLAEIRIDRAKKAGPQHWRTLLEKGMPIGGFDHIRSVWVYEPGEKKIHYRPDGATTPDNATLSIVPGRSPLIDVKASETVIEGLTLRGGPVAIRLGEGADKSVVRRCAITSFENTGILITGNASGCLVEDCSVTRGSFEEWCPPVKPSRYDYEIWQFHKQVGRYDRIGINLIRAGAGNRILRNHVDRTFDGINIGDASVENLDKPLVDPNHGRGTEIAKNIIENTRDSGIELGVGCIDVEVHHNILTNTHGGLRFKLPRIGPVYVHHNHLLHGAPFNIWFSMDASPAEGYIYHNTIEGGGYPAITYSSFNAKRDFGTPKWHFLNNLILDVPKGFFDRRPNTPEADFTESNNVTTHDRAAAIDAGKDLSTYRDGKPLPGCGKETVKGKAPDAGADER